MGVCFVVIKFEEVIGLSDDDDDDDSDDDGDDDIVDEVKKNYTMYSLYIFYF